jgi:hypothetical protein
MTKIIRFAALAFTVSVLVASPAAASRSHCDRGGVPNRRHYN